MLIDTNIIVEIGRSQPHRKECKELLDAIRFGMLDESVYITRFALSAIETLISKSNTDFLREILLLVHQNKIKVLETKIDDDLMVNSIKNDLSLDFDDALQFLAANQLGTYLVTYDKDFSHTSLQTKTPEEILKNLSTGK